MIKEVKKIYSIELVKFDGSNQNELVEFSDSKGYRYIDNDFVLVEVKSNSIPYFKDIRVPIGSYLVKDEENNSIFVVDSIGSLIDIEFRGEISIEDEDLIKELFDSYAQEANKK